MSYRTEIKHVWTRLTFLLDDRFVGQNVLLWSACEETGRLKKRV